MLRGLFKFRMLHFDMISLSDKNDVLETVYNVSGHGLADKFVCQTFQDCHGTSCYINKLEILTFFLLFKGIVLCMQ